MAITDTNMEQGAKAFSNKQIAMILLVLAALFAFARPILPEGLVRVSESMVPPFAIWLDAIFEFIKGDIQNERWGLVYITRWIAEGPLEASLDTTGNLLYGKRRWPNLGPIPWTAVAAVAGILGYWLGGWRLALLAAGTFIWTAMIGQWKLAMQTMSVIAVAAPMAFFIGLSLGVLAWKSPRFDRFMLPILSVLQTLPFFTYLLPAVIFFKVGPTAGCVATIVYAIPPMVLMTTLGLKKVPEEVVEAGKMSGSSRWQMLRYVYIPAARTEILVGVNQVIMLCLAMVVLTAFIGMPGLGAKLLALMGSFKLGRSFEIGVTIVLLAVTLDRLSKAWVVKQPEHFERGTSWFRQHRVLLGGIVAFVAFIIMAQFIQVFDHISRKQDLSVGKELDVAIKAFLNIDSIQAVTEWLRWFLNVKVLIPFRNGLLWLPTPTIVLALAALGYYIGGIRTSLIAGGFFFIVALTGWWDRAIITLYTVVSAVVISAMIGIPLGIWAARGAAQPMTSKSTSQELLIGTIGLVFKRLPIVMLAAISAGMLHFFNGSERAFLSPLSLSFWVFAIALTGLWLLVRRWSRDQVVLVIADTAQTFPSFIYLIPAIMLFGVNDVAVVFSIVIFATVPLTRYTIEGLRAVPPELSEAADMSGATRSQKLWNVQLPLALPTMAVGFNQAIMFAFFMVIIAAFIGTQDIGQELQRTLAGGDLGKNIVLGICVSLMALAFDHMIMRWATDRKKALGVG